MTNTKALKMAHRIQKSGFTASFSESMKKGWILAKISLGIPTMISFAKTETGEVREAKAIQLGSIGTIQDGYVRFIEDDNGTAQWRSFKIENLMTA